MVPDTVQIFQLLIFRNLLQSHRYQWPYIPLRIRRISPALCWQLHGGNMKFSQWRNTHGRGGFWTSDSRWFSLYQNTPLPLIGISLSMFLFMFLEPKHYWTYVQCFLWEYTSLNTFLHLASRSPNSPTAQHCHNSAAPVRVLFQQLIHSPHSCRTTHSMQKKVWTMLFHWLVLPSAF